jgi:hypothetical protein
VATSKRRAPGAPLHTGVSGRVTALSVQRANGIHWNRDEIDPTMLFLRLPSEGAARPCGAPVGLSPSRKKYLDFC